MPQAPASSRKRTGQKMNTTSSLGPLPNETSLPSRTFYGPRLFLEYNMGVIGEFGSEQPGGALSSSRIDADQDVCNLFHTRCKAQLTVILSIPDATYIYSD